MGLKTCKINNPISNARIKTLKKDLEIKPVIATPNIKIVIEKDS